MKSESDRKSLPYESALQQLGAVNAVFPEDAKSQMTEMLDQISRSDTNIRDIIGSGQSVPVKAGFVAEEMHAETFNLESILQRKSLRSLTDRYTEWKDLGLRGNDPTADVVVSDGSQILHRAQVKYYEDADHTANALREFRDGAPHYQEADSFVAPSDQISPQDGSTSIADHATRTELKNAQTRPEVADAARQVRERASDRVSVDGVESRPVSKAESRDVARGNEEGTALRSEYQDSYMTQSTLHQMRRAAAAGAATTALVVGTLNTLRYCSLVSQGKLEPEEAVLQIVKSTALSSLDSAVKAAAGAGAVSVVTRQGSQLLANQALGGLLAKNAIVGGAICGVDLVKCLVLAAAGRMTLGELEERTGKNIFTTGAGVAGSAIGMNLLAGSSVVFAPIIGALAGGLIGGLAMQLAIENHIEKPYQELMRNTALLEESGQAMRETAVAFVAGQHVFAAFLKREQEVEQQLTGAILRIDTAGDNMSQAIDRI